jgi:hypothetical protein
MFLVNSQPASVLFDSGASHSFITTQYVAKHGLPMVMMKYPMLISSPGGEIRAKYMCPRMKLKIRGVDFPANLIVLESKGIDVILGMDWLAKYNGVIECARRAVHLTNGDGTKVEFVATIPAIEDCSLNLLEDAPIDQIRVVCEFPDVFPDELPGMPLDRDIEFVIELVPGMATIAKRPYRMSANDLAELKKQIQEQLDKGFIRPSASP